MIVTCEHPLKNFFRVKGYSVSTDHVLTIDHVLLVHETFARLQNETLLGTRGRCAAALRLPLLRRERTCVVLYRAPCSAHAAPWV